MRETADARRIHRFFDWVQRQFIGAFRVLFDEGTHCMIAEPVARRPVGDVRIDPALEDGKILALIPTRKGVSPLRNDERLLHVSRPVEFLTEQRSPALGGS